MALKVALPKLDKRAVSLARARFRAWWEGGEFDEAAALAAIAAVANDGGVDAELFAEAEPADPRLEALQRLWGQGRLMAGNEEAEAAMPAALSLSASASLAVFGPGLVAPVSALASTHVGPLRVFEWREESFGALRRGVARAKLGERVEAAGIDLETFTPPTEAFDGLVSFDDFTYADNAARLAQQFARTLKPKARAIVECYSGAPGPDLAGAFASAFREPQIRAADTLAALFEEAGLRVEDNADAIDAHVAQARDGFRRLGEAISQSGPPSADTARELSWETSAWRVRVRLLAARRLERRRFTLVRR
jgi:SAM-dependent methyltransferase